MDTHSQETLSEVKSSAYPKLERVPGKQNWVDRAGGLPSYIERIAKHLHYEKGFPIGTAIAIAVNTVKRWASAGTVTKKGGHQVTAATRAKAAKAVAEWEAKKKAGSKKMNEAAADDEVETDETLDVLMEAEAFEAVIEPRDLTEDAVKYLSRNFGHSLSVSEGLVRSTMGDGTGAQMTPEERQSVAARFENRLSLLEGVTLSLSGKDERAQSLAVANAYQMLSPGSRAVRVSDVPASVSAEVIRGALAQITPEVLGLCEAIEQLSKPKPLIEADAVSDYPNLMTPNTSSEKCEKCGHTGVRKKLSEGTGKKCKECGQVYRAYEMQEAKAVAKCKKCNHSISSHDKDGKCSDCAKDKKLDEAMRGQRAKGTLPAANNDSTQRKGDEPYEDEISAEAKANANADSDRVKHLQSRLDSLGFEAKDDGIFGPKTEGRVKEFQMHAGLVQDGVVGPNTTSALRLAPDGDEMGNVVFKENEEPKAIRPSDAKDAKKKVEKVKSESVTSTSKSVQEGLADGFGSESEMGPTIMPDDLNLLRPVTPIEVPRKEENFQPPTQTKPKKKKKPARDVMFKGLGVGDLRSDSAVKDMQSDLGSVGYNLTQDGRFGPETEQAVKRFQRKYGLKADGVVGAKTKRTIKGVKQHLATIDEALMDQNLAVDAAEWQESHDWLVDLKRELAEAEKRGEQAWPELEGEQLEEATRGAAREVVAKLKRLPDGTFAPKGLGAVLTPGDKVEVPNGGGKGVVTADGTVAITDGARKGEKVKLSAPTLDADALGDVVDSFDHSGPGGDRAMPKAVRDALLAIPDGEIVEIAGVKVKRTVSKNEQVDVPGVGSIPAVKWAVAGNGIGPNGDWDSNLSSPWVAMQSIKDVRAEREESKVETLKVSLGTGKPAADPSVEAPKTPDDAKPAKHKRIEDLIAAGVPAKAAIAQANEEEAKGKKPERVERPTSPAQAARNAAAAAKHPIGTSVTTEVFSSAGGTESGDMVTGEVVGHKRGELMVKTEDRGTIAVPLDKVIDAPKSPGTSKDFGKEARQALEDAGAFDASRDPFDMNDIELGDGWTAVPAGGSAKGEDNLFSLHDPSGEPFGENGIGTANEMTGIYADARTNGAAPTTETKKTKEQGVETVTLSDKDAVEIKGKTVSKIVRLDDAGYAAFVADPQNSSFASSDQTVAILPPLMTPGSPNLGKSKAFLVDTSGATKLSAKEDLPLRRFAAFTKAPTKPKKKPAKSPTGRAASKPLSVQVEERGIDSTPSELADDLYGLVPDANEEDKAYWESLAVAPEESGDYFFAQIMLTDLIASVKDGSWKPSPKSDPVKPSNAESSLAASALAKYPVGTSVTTEKDGEIVTGKVGSHLGSGELNVKTEDGRYLIVPLDKVLPPSPESTGTLNLKNAGPSGKPRNVKSMGDAKLMELSAHPDVEFALKKRVDAELIARDKLTINGKPQGDALKVEFAADASDDDGMNYSVELSGWLNSVTEPESGNPSAAIVKEVTAPLLAGPESWDGKQEEHLWPMTFMSDKSLSGLSDKELVKLGNVAESANYHGLAKRLRGLVMNGTGEKKTSKKPTDPEKAIKDNIEGKSSAAIPEDGAVVQMKNISIADLPVGSSVQLAKDGKPQNGAAKWTKTADGWKDSEVPDFSLPDITDAYPANTKVVYKAPSNGEGVPIGSLSQKGGSKTVEDLKAKNDTGLPDDELVAVLAVAGSNLKAPLSDLPAGTILDLEPEYDGGGTKGVVSVNDKGKKVVYEVQMIGNTPKQIKANQNRKFFVESHPNIDVGLSDFTPGSTKAPNRFIPDSELEPAMTVKGMEASGALLGAPKAPKAPAEKKTKAKAASGSTETVLSDNIGDNATSVKDLVPGQPLMLANGEEYTYHKPANPNSPFHIIKPKGWTEDNDLKAKPMHGELVPPKIGPAPGEEKKAAKPKPSKAESKPADDTMDSAKIDAALAKYQEVKDGDATAENKAELDALWAEMIAEMEKDDPAISMQMESAAPHAEDPKWQAVDKPNAQNKALEVYKAAGGNDQAIIDALNVAEASGLDFDEALALVESLAVAAGSDESMIA